jgi:hypothetical protein
MVGPASSPPGTTALPPTTCRTPIAAQATPMMRARTWRAVDAVLKGWLVFVQVLCVDWLERETCTRVESREVAIGGLRGALGPLLKEG